MTWAGDFTSEIDNLKSTDVIALNQTLKQKSLDEVLLWAHQMTNDGKYLLPVTSFGLSGLVILHRMEKLGILQKVLTIDTQHLFPETYAFIETWKTKTHVLIGRPIEKEFDQNYGSNLYQTDPARYAFFSKVGPLQRALSKEKTKIWITGRRRSQGNERSNMNILEIDSSSNFRWKLNPLAFWSFQDVQHYIKKNEIPHNPLYDDGYTSIGDHMTTSPNSSNDERRGRVFFENSSECGCHL